MNWNDINNLIGLLRIMFCAVMIKEYLAITGTSNFPWTAASRLGHRERLSGQLMNSPALHFRERESK